MKTNIDTKYFSQIQSDNFKKAVYAFNNANEKLTVARIDEAIEKLEMLLSNEDVKHPNPLYYPVVDLAGIALEHLKEIRKAF